MSGKNVWNRIFIFEKFSFFGPKYVKKMVFLRHFRFPGPKNWKMGKKREKIKNLLPTFFLTCFHLDFSQFSAVMDYLGESFMIFSGNWILTRLSTMATGLFRDIENSVSRQRIKLFQFCKKRHTRGMKPFHISPTSKIDPPTPPIASSVCASYI